MKVFKEAKGIIDTTVKLLDSHLLNLPPFADLNNHSCIFAAC